MKTKKEIRGNFRQSVFDRDHHRCVMCPSPAVDAHHITGRTEMPNGGYVPENGISLCAACHLRAEAFHISGGQSWEPGFHPNDLYAKIGSSHERAVEASKKLAN